MSLLGVANCHDNRGITIDLIGGILGQVIIEDIYVY